MFPIGKDQGILRKICSPDTRANKEAETPRTQANRFPILLPIEEPVLLLCCLKSPVDFFLGDTPPAQVLFLLFSPSTHIHFQIVAFLTVLLSDSLLKDLVLMGAPREAILDRVSVMERNR